MSNDNRASVQPNEDELRKLIKEALEGGVFGYREPLDLYDPELEAICERKGYGYVMALAESAWARKCRQGGCPAGANHTVAAAAVIRKDWCKRAKDAIEGHPPF